jgi:hypothetical protein
MFLSEKRIVAIFLLFYIPLQVLGQEKGNDLLALNKNKIKISLSTVFYSNLKFIHNGYEYLNSDRLPSIVTNMLYHQSFKNGFGVNTGLGLSVVPQNANYNFSSSLNEPLMQQMNHKLYDINYSLLLGEFPISLQKFFLLRIKETKSLFASLEVGLKYNFVLDNPYYIVSYIYPAQNTAEVFFQLDYYNFRTSLESYFIKFGLISPSGRKNTIHYNIVFNYSPKKILKGTYNFYFLPNESYGSFKQGINYIGLEFSYGFSRK